MTASRRGRVELTRAYHFSAGHRLASPALDAEENARIYGACHRPHGHNYYVEVTVAGTPDPETGMAVDLGEVDAVVARTVLDEVDHHTLEEAPVLAGVITTGEGLARAFWRALEPALPRGTLVGIVVQETRKNRFAYRGAR
ncbi:MAG: 6-carboxytetrahydropterin synthase [Candidatus Rokubacteria bacterium]|nr:6-carboxytetrahydropterin synthase [Candidatus Rokubacteria bacterium]